MLATMKSTFHGIPARLQLWFKFDSFLLFTLIGCVWCGQRLKNCTRFYLFLTCNVSPFFHFPFSTLIICVSYGRSIWLLQVWELKKNLLFENYLQFVDIKKFFFHSLWSFVWEFFFIIFLVRLHICAVQLCIQDSHIWCFKSFKTVNGISHQPNNDVVSICSMSTKTSNMKVDFCNWAFLDLMFDVLRNKVVFLTVNNGDKSNFNRIYETTKCSFVGWKKFCCLLRNRPTWMAGHLSFLRQTQVANQCALHSIYTIYIVSLVSRWQKMNWNFNILYGKCGDGSGDGGGGSSVCMSNFFRNQMRNLCNFSWERIVEPYFPIAFTHMTIFWMEK